MKNFIDIPDYLLTLIVNQYIQLNNKELNQFLRDNLGWKNPILFLDFKDINTATIELSEYAKLQNITFKHAAKSRQKNIDIDFQKVIVLANKENQEIVLLDFSKVIPFDKLNDTERFKSIYYNFNEPRILASNLTLNLKEIHLVEIASNTIEFVKQFNLGCANTFTNELNNQLFRTLTYDNFKTQVINDLINKGADINALDKEGHTVLSYLLGFGWGYPIIDDNIDAQFNRQLKIVEQLIIWGINVNHIVHTTPTIQFIRGSLNYKLIEPLIKAGCKPNQQELEVGSCLIDDIAADIQFKIFENKYLGYLETIYQILEKYEVEN